MGPNGCGKSNIVDAILWGLGEPNARNLRATTSQDVIFSGSAQRKPLGYAEVSLLFDNEDGALDVDTPEVSVSRRLNRAGESEYSINKHPCRQKDIFDLLADSGLGRSGYAIVGQKEIDAALSASPEDRRAWIDEAAGVQRYRARRTDSLRRLESATQHLARVEDILREIETQREPLREEAERARQYKSVLEALRSVESGLLAVEVARAVRDLDSIDERIAKSLETSEQEAKRAEKLEQEMRRLGESISEVERELDAVRELQQSALTARERAEANHRLAAQKLASLDDLEANLSEEQQAGKRRIEEAEADLHRLVQEEIEESSALERLRAELSGVDEEARGLLEELRKAEAQLDQARKVEAERVRLEADSRAKKHRLKQVREEMRGIEQSMPDLISGIADAETSLTELERQASEHRNRIEQSEKRLSGAREGAESGERDRRRALAELASLDGKLRGIEATIEAHEGLAQGPRAVMDAVKRGELHGEFTPVAEAIVASKELALAIETALGGAAHDLIVPDDGHAKRAIEYLKRTRMGRATFQPVNLMRPSAVGRELERVLSDKGVLGLASELVECKDDHRPVVDSLLGRVVITRSLDVSLRLARTSGWSRLVSLEGEVVHASGAVSGGTTSRHGSGLLHRRAELDATQKEIARLREALARFEEARARHEAEVERVKAEMRAEQAALSSLQPDLDDARKWLHSLQQERAAAERSFEKLSQELELLKSESVEIPEPVDLDALQQAKDSAVALVARKSADADQASERLKEAEARAKQASERRLEAEQRLARIGESESHRAKRLASLDDERARHREHMARHAIEREEAMKRYDVATAQLEEAQATKRQMLELSFELAEHAKDAQKSAIACAELAHQAELDRARTDARRAASQQRLLEEYGIDEDEALRQAASTELPRDATTLVGRLRRELKSMGEVNLGAIDAFDRLTERFDELSQQHSDVSRGRDEILAGIRELDRLTRDRFRSTFESVQSAFQEMIGKLFGGGEGQLSLTDPENLLETGVGVSVTTPGKRPQGLELLSGGERALAACAFLFALLKVKPSPLVVLDEIDAPLDGRNVERFISVLKEFAGGVQFLLITHNPTTIESAPIWFGVTMQEPGVSTVVPFRTPQAARVPQAYVKG